MDKNIKISRNFTGPIILIAVGIILLVNNLYPEWGLAKLWPILIIVLGIDMIIKRK